MFDFICAHISWCCSCCCYCNVVCTCFASLRNNIRVGFRFQTLPCYFLISIYHIHTYITYIQLLNYQHIYLLILLQTYILHNLFREGKGKYYEDDPKIPWDKTSAEPFSLVWSDITWIFNELKQSDLISFIYEETWRVLF